MLYARMNEAGTTFEPERESSMHRSFGLDGGGSVAADTGGNVYVVWHGISTELKSGSGAMGEARRKVWVMKSADNGKSFQTEARAWQQPTGACACCGVKAFSSRNGSVRVRSLGDRGDSSGHLPLDVNRSRKELSRRTPSQVGH